MLERRGGIVIWKQQARKMAVNSSRSGVSRQICEVAIQKYSLAYCSEKNTHRNSHLEERRERDRRERNWPPSTPTHTAAPRAPAEAREHGERKQQAVEYIEARRACSRFQKLQSLHGAPGGSTFCGRWSPVRGKKEKRRLITAEVPGSRQGEKRPDPKMRARPRWYLKQQQITGATAST